VFDIECQRERERGNAGMRVKAKTGPRTFGLDIVQKNKGLEQLTHITGAHEPGDWALSLPSGAGNNLAG
jgi:hypothetical protein